jgi:hypothetical protein
MRPDLRLAVLVILLAFGTASCESPSGPLVSGLQGRVYANAGPGWHDYLYPCTIVVSTDARRRIGEFPTDSAGTFRIPLPFGSYLLDVKESPDSATSGPYRVSTFSYVEARAYVYNSMILSPAGRTAATDAPREERTR